MIRAVQTYLRTQGVDIAVDGSIGPKTVNALNAYKKTTRLERRK
jgi:lysozyme family protein